MNRAGTKQSRALQHRSFSRSKLELYVECARCFYDEVVYGLRRVSGPAFTLNIAVDALFKREFDHYRALGQPHPLFATVGLDAVPLQDERLERWRNAFKGARYTCATTGWSLTGGLDDVWQAPDGTVYVADYKATAKDAEVTAEGLYPGYRRQMEIYQWLLQAEGCTVSDTAWFVYANGVGALDRFDDRLTFRTKLVRYDGDRSWVPGAFIEAVQLVESRRRPLPAEACSWCRYAAMKRALEPGAAEEGTAA
jgi:hypothetical protein